jgi:hypothetical protein
MPMRPAFLALGLVVALRPGCGPHKPKKEPQGESHKIPAWCHEGADPCEVGCIERHEGQPCGTCCFEQLILCNEGQAYDFKKCDTAARDR